MAVLTIFLSLPPARDGWEGSAGREAGQGEVLCEAAGGARPLRRAGGPAQGGLRWEGGDGQDLPGERWSSLFSAETNPAGRREERAASGEKWKPSAGNNGDERKVLKSLLEWGRKEEGQTEKDNQMAILSRPCLTSWFDSDESRERTSCSLLIYSTLIELTHKMRSIVH